MKIRVHLSARNAADTPRRTLNIYLIHVNKQTCTENIVGIGKLSARMGVQVTVRTVLFYFVLILLQSGVSIPTVCIWDRKIILIG